MGKPKFKKNHDNIDYALRLISNGASINNASKVYKVPVATLWRKTKRRETARTGPKTHLSNADEVLLIKYAEFAANMGSPVHIGWIRLMAGRIADKR